MNLYKIGRFEINENQNLIRNYEQIKSNLATKKEIVIDARPPKEYSQGNIPNSINVPYDELFDPKTKTIKNKKNLIKCNQIKIKKKYFCDTYKFLLVFQNKGVDTNRPLIASCKTSVAASSLALAGYLIGIKTLPVYSVINCFYYLNIYLKKILNA